MDTAKLVGSDTEQCLAAVNRLYWHLDFYEFDAMAALMTADGYYARPDGSHVLRDNLAADMNSRLPKGVNMAHVLTNLDVLFSGSHRAAVRGFLMAYAHKPPEAGQVSPMVQPKNQFALNVQLKKTAESGWKISEVNYKLRFGSVS